jgi:RsiW-degrading membrane proteinase PrsW (M82 family)
MSDISGAAGVTDEAAQPEAVQPEAVQPKEARSDQPVQEQSAQPVSVQPQLPVYRAPRKWLGPRGHWWLLLFGGGTLLIYFLINAVFGPHYAVYRSLPTSTLALGAILAAVCVFYSMLYRLRPQDGVSIALLFGALGIAAFGTTLAAAELNGVIARAALAAHLAGSGLTGSGQRIGLVSTLFAGPVEETLKGLTVLLIGLAVRTKTFRGGLFLGGAVGLGFAVVENLQYFTNAWEHPALHLSQLGMLGLATGARTVITPILHPILTALLGGALFATARTVTGRSDRYRLTVPLIGTYFAVVGIHSLWDSLGLSISLLTGTLPRAAVGGLALLALLIMLGILIGLPLVWRAVARHADVLAGYRPPKPRYQVPTGPPPGADGSSSN